MVVAGQRHYKKTNKRIKILKNKSCKSHQLDTIHGPSGLWGFIRHHIIRRPLAILLSWLPLLFLPRIALAVLIPPQDKNITVPVHFDRPWSGGDINIWAWERGAADTSNPSAWGRSSYTCLSASNPATGACPTRAIWGAIYGTTSIILSFKERRSQAIVNLTLQGQLGRASFGTGGTSCKNPEYVGMLHSAFHHPGCNVHGNLIPYETTAVNVIVPASELTKIPSGGIWTATLILREIQWRNRPAATWTANITLDVTDRNNGAIYLPAFGRADPLVDLNLRTKPLSTAPGGEVSGSTVIDTCLYDGYNANSAWLQVTLSDLLPPRNRSADIFSVTKTGTTGGNPRDRIDYRVTMNYNGKPITMENSKAITLNGVDSALIRPVTLPGFPVPVVCTPAPLTLTVLPFAKASKTAGRYSGTLWINLAARTLAP